MPEEIKHLIEKIQQEGIQVAQVQARAIEDTARQNAEKIIREATQRAQQLLAGAKIEITQLQEKQKAALRQAARDTLLLLRNEINATLQKLILSGVKDALSPELLVKMITSLVKQVHEKGTTTEVVLSKADYAGLEKEIFAHLGAELKKGVVLRPTEEISGGFTISFDNGKSEFDFTDSGLAEYIGKYLKPNLAEILKEAV